MAETNIIATEWRNFAKRVYPDAGPVQLVECRRSFYAGAIFLFAALCKCLDVGEEPTADDLAKMDSISREFDQYFKDLAVAQLKERFQS